MFNISACQKEIVGVVLVFAFVFSFYIIGAITSSIVVGLLISPCFVFKKYYRSFLNECLKPYIFSLFLFQWILIGIGFLYSVFYSTYDFSYIKILFAQSIHLFFGVLIVSFLKSGYKIDAFQLERYIIYAYILQSVIQLVAFAYPSFAGIMIYFNRSDNLQEATAGVRGLALSSATGWSLALSYGLVFIIYTKHYMLGCINFKILLGWVCLFVGTIFAGRTGLVGSCIGVIYFLFCNHQNPVKRIWYIIKLLLGIASIATLLYILFPVYIGNIVDYVFPFAFEPVYNFLKGEGFTTRSTNILSEMWDVSLSLKEFFWGTGYFTNPNGSYYRHTDVGVLRNLFYWGIGGYFVLILYQLRIIQPIWQLRETRFMCFFIMLFLCLAEYKAMTFGINKQVFSVLFLLSSCYWDEESRNKI